MNKKILLLLLGLSLILTGCGSKEVDLTTGEVMLESEDRYSDMKNKNNIIGVSDKNFLELTTREPTDVRNSKNGWKKSTLSENAKIEEYLMSYKKLYMEEGDVHYIINFNYNTTTRINYLNELIYVTTMERVDKEEHDAKTIGSGMVLGESIIYPNGDIEKVGD